MNFVQDNDVHNNKAGTTRTSLVIYSLGNKHFWYNNIGNHRVAKSEPASSSRAGECWFSTHKMTILLTSKFVSLHMFLAEKAWDRCKWVHICFSISIGRCPCDATEHKLQTSNGLYLRQVMPKKMGVNWHSYHLHYLPYARKNLTQLSPMKISD